MKKNRFTYIFIFLITIFSFILSFSPSFSSFVVSNDYNTTSSIPIDKQSTLQIDNYENDATTPYKSFTTLEGAIRNANSKMDNGSTKIDCYLRIGANLTTTNQQIVLKSGVNLLLPYDGTTVFTNAESDFSGYVNNSFIDCSTANVNAKRKTHITFVNTTLIIQQGASLVVGGEFGAKGVCGRYGEITLDRTSSIECRGNINCFGYIKELNTVNSSQAGNESCTQNECDPYRFIKVTSTGQVIIPMALNFSWSGGTLKELYDTGLLPFNIFEFPNLQTYVEYDVGAKMDFYIRIGVKTRVQNQYLSDSYPGIRSVASGENALFKIGAKSSGNSYFAMEYCPNNTNGFTSRDSLSTYDSSKTSNRTKLFVNSAFDFGYITMSIAGLVSIDSRNFFLPIPYTMYIYCLNGGIINLTQKIKFLDSSMLKILNGGTLNISSSIVFYKANSFQGLVSAGYPTSGFVDDARLINNGALNILSGGKLGAYVETENDGGTANINLSAVTSSDQLVCSSLEGLAQREIKIISKGMFLNNGVAINAKFKEGENYTSSNITSLFCWVGNYIITYTLHVTFNTPYDYNVGGYQLYLADNQSGSNEVELTGGYTSAEEEHLINQGKYLKIVTSRCASSAFLNSSLTFINNTYFLMNSDLELEITSYEGCLISLFTQGLSGAGSATYTLTEVNSGYTVNITSNTPDSQKYNGNIGDLFIKGEQVTIKNTKGGSGTTSFDKAYIGDGIRTVSPAASVSDWPTEFATQNNLTNTQILFSSSNGSATITLNTHKVVYCSRSESSCITPDTLITMADGSYKEAQYIQTGDMVKAMNHETGQIDIVPIVFNDDLEKETQIYNVIHLEFSNGKEVKIVSEHGFFDKTLNKYVYIHEYDYNDYIGHKFISINNNDEISEVVLNNAYIKEEYTRICEPDSYFHLNFITNDMLSMPGGISGLFNIFEYEDNSLKYDEIKKANDINAYGLYTYDDFKEYMSEDIFNAFPIIYLKVSLAKGMITEERMQYLINRYIPIVNDQNGIE